MYKTKNNTKNSIKGGESHSHARLKTDHFPGSLYYESTYGVPVYDTNTIFGHEEREVRPGQRTGKSQCTHKIDVNSYEEFEKYLYSKISRRTETIYLPEYSNRHKTYGTVLRMTTNEANEEYVDYKIKYDSSGLPKSDPLRYAKDYSILYKKIDVNLVDKLNNFLEKIS